MSDAPVPPNPPPESWRELHPKIADHQFLLTKGVSIDENGFLHLDRVAMTAIWKMLLDLQAAAHDLHPSAPPAEVEELVAKLSKSIFNIDGRLLPDDAAPIGAPVRDIRQAASALTSLSLRVKELEEALSKIEGGWIDEDIPEDDPHDQFSAALQRIARAVLPESAIRRARTVLHGEGE
jgi:hypothetical protein